MLLFHGLGTGKTCSSIGVAEEMRKYMGYAGIKNRIIIVASPNVQNNYRSQLFDERKLVKQNNRWSYKGCVGNNLIKEVNPMNIELSKEKLVSLINRVINNNYLFIGYTKLANFIASKAEVSDLVSETKKEELIKKKLNKVFSNRLIIIDEVHNIRTTEDNSDKKVGMELFRLVENVKNLKLLLLSATPLYNSFKEIVWLLNLMNINDQRLPVEFKDIFNNDGSFKLNEKGEEIGKELLIRKSTGYVSFVKGENPYTFPYRIFPSQFNELKSIFSIVYPRFMLTNKPLDSKIEMVDIYINNLDKYQEFIYQNLVKQLFFATKQKPESSGLNSPHSEVSNDEELNNPEITKIGYSKIMPLLQSLNIVFPVKNVTFDNIHKFDLKDLLGKKGLQNIMKYNENWSQKSVGDFRYKSNCLKDFGKIFELENIGNYSKKIHSICNNILNSTGVILVYSDFIDAGLLPTALALAIGHPSGGLLLLAPSQATFAAQYVKYLGALFYASS